MRQQIYVYLLISADPRPCTSTIRPELCKASEELAPDTSPKSSETLASPGSTAASRRWGLPHHAGRIHQVLRISSARHIPEQTSRHAITTFFIDTLTHKGPDRKCVDETGAKFKRPWLLTRICPTKRAIAGDDERARRGKEHDLVLRATCAPYVGGARIAVDSSWPRCLSRAMHQRTYLVPSTPRCRTHTSSDGWWWISTRMAGQPTSRSILEPLLVRGLSVARWRNPHGKHSVRPQAPQPYCSAL